MDATHLEAPISRRAQRCRLREAREARHLREAQEQAYLIAQVQPGEDVVAHLGKVMVTDRRVLVAWSLSQTPEGSRWFCDALSFEEITRWSVGRRHDERPLLLLEHPTHVRTEWVPAHNVLWFRWGNAEADLPHNDITLAFRSGRDEVFRAICDRLRNMNLPRGEDFLIALPGTREERTRGSAAYLRA